MKHHAQKTALLFTQIILLLFFTSTSKAGAGTNNLKWDKNLTARQLDSITNCIISQMNLREKVNEMHGKGAGPLGLGILFKGHGLPVKAGGSKKFKIPTQLFSDGPRGVVCANSTCFPVTMARGASWDKDLEQRVGDAMGQECRASGSNYSGAVCINVLRNPLWGRCQETYGEDPWLLGEMGSALVKGFQQNNVNACIKHFAANSMENNRYAVNVKMDERTLREVYLPQFKKCIDNGALSVMSSYNQLNGSYNGHNRYLLTDILRKDWSFKGYVTSDWDNGIYDAEKAINAGMNVEMSKGRCYSLKNIINLLRQKKITLSQLDSLIFSTIRTKILFASQIDKLKYNKGMIVSPQHQQLALEVADKSAVLLKNENALLPLDKKKITKVAIIGTLAKSQNTGDHGSSWVRTKHVVSPFEGIKNFLKNTSIQILTAKSTDTSSISKICKEADVVIIVAGLNFEDEGEFISMVPKKIRNPNKPEKGIAFKLGIVGRAGDRTNLNLKNEDVNLIKTASSVSNKVVVCLVSGGPIMVEDWYNEVPSILQTFYSGMEGGTSLARMLFGEVNPSGKLPFSVPKRQTDLPPFNSYASEVDYGYYHGYTLFDKQNITPRFPFGYGLSYTNFNFSKLKIITPQVNSNTPLQCSIEVENTGERSGEEVAQLYIGFGESKIDRPVKILRGFNKISLEAHEKKTIIFHVKPEDLAYYDPDTKSWKVENMVYEIYLGNSSAPASLQKATFRATGF